MRVYWAALLVFDVALLVTTEESAIAMAAIISAALPMALGLMQIRNALKSRGPPCR